MPIQRHSDCWQVAHLWNWCLWQRATNPLCLKHSLWLFSVLCKNDSHQQMGSSCEHGWPRWGESKNALESKNLHFFILLFSSTRACSMAASSELRSSLVRGSWPHKVVISQRNVHQSFHWSKLKTVSFLHLYWKQVSHFDNWLAHRWSKPCVHGKHET